MTMAASTRLVASAPPSPIAIAVAALVDLGARAGLDAGELEPARHRYPVTGPWQLRLGELTAAPDDRRGSGGGLDGHRETRSLAVLSAVLGLGAIEQLAIALLIALEEDPVLARLVQALQAPLPGSRPTVGLLAAAFEPAADPSAAALGHATDPPAAAFDLLVDGPAVAAGAIVLRGDDLPLVERRIALSPPVHAALRGLDAPAPGATLRDAPPIALPTSILAEAARHAAGFGPDHRALILRTPSIPEGRAVAAAIARALGADLAFLDGDPAPGLGLWLTLRGLLPVFRFELGPGERRRLPALPGYAGPILALAGLDGTIDCDGVAAPSWQLAVPTTAERIALWRTAIGDPELAAQLGAEHRHGAGRIAQLGRASRRLAQLSGAPQIERPHVRAAAWTSDGPSLRGMAEPIDDDVPDHGLVTTPPLRRDLDLLLLRCRHRDGQLDDLGPAMRARHRPGVRALFVGPSGTGKTFAASWLASRLCAPLYRVDLASITSKYIGETEKNLAHLLAQAEHEEIVLLFDEADSMFGKRTDVKDANDRFANAQTNFLLQRIEAFDGIVLLTSNSRSRIDAAFTRRLDAVIEFPPPGPEERRALWQVHLGDGHALDAPSINRLAAVCDLAGGHVRNAVLCASLLARRTGRRIGLADLVAGLAVEYRKVGRSPPPDLGDPHEAWR